MAGVGNAVVDFVNRVFFAAFGADGIFGGLFLAFLFRFF